MKALRSEPELSLARESQIVLSTHAKTFRWAQLFLNRQQREDSAIAYAFCRLVDDTVDEARSPEEAARELNRLEAELLLESPPRPLLHAYQELAERCEFGLTPARDLIAGARSDLGLVRVRSDAELQTYCYRVAGTVGLMMSGILGVRDPTALKHAIDLGIAMQLTNICRDVREDAGRGRVYLPLDRLTARGLSAEDLLHGSDLDRPCARRDALSQVTRELLSIADVTYEAAERGFHYLPLRARLAICVASRLYAGIGRRLRRTRKSDPWRGRVRVPLAEKLLLTLSALHLWFQVSWRKPSPSSAPPLLHG